MTKSQTIDKYTVNQWVYDSRLHACRSCLSLAFTQYKPNNQNNKYQNLKFALSFKITNA